MARSACRPDRSIILASLGIGGLALVGLGAALPWITIFHGLTPVNGLSGDGTYLLGVATGAALLEILYLRTGRPRPLQWLAAGAAALTVAYAGFDAWRLARYVGDPGPAGALSAPAFGPGSLVLMAGALMLLASLLFTPAKRQGLPAGMFLPLLTSISLFIAGWIHVALTGEHLEEATILGTGFLLSGVAQIVLAATVALRPRRYAYVAVIAVNAALIFLYVYAVIRGLPFGGHDHGGGLVVGAGEPIELAGAVSKAAEILSLVGAFALLGRGELAGVRGKSSV